MPKVKKVFVSIFCKIYTDNFSEEMVNRKATGQEIYKFLMRDAGQCFDSNGEPIPGDCNLWYSGQGNEFAAVNRVTRTRVLATASLASSSTRVRPMTSPRTASALSGEAP